MRTFARYSAHLPLEIIDQELNIETEYITGIGYGGMCLDSDIPLEVGETINFRIPLLNLGVSAIGEVKWQKKESNRYLIGVEFIHRHKDLTEPLVDQIYYIESYYENALGSGRQLTLEDAAVEWQEEQRHWA